MTAKVYIEIISPLYHKKIASALKHDAAIVLAKTQVGGYTGDPRQVDHIVSYALYGLNRLLDLPSEAKLRLVKFDSYHLINAKPIRSTSSLRKKWVSDSFLRHQETVSSLTEYKLHLYLRLDISVVLWWIRLVIPTQAYRSGRSGIFRCQWRRLIADAHCIPLSTPRLHLRYAVI
jgi:hypothetical protein